MNIIEKTDEEILAIADPLWRDLVKNSNEGKYGEFVKNFSSSLARAMDQVVAGHQFANSELARSLSDEVDYLGIIRRGEHVTVLYRQRSTKKAGRMAGQACPRLRRWKGQDFRCIHLLSSSIGLDMGETIRDSKFVELTYKVTDRKSGHVLSVGRIPVGLCHGHNEILAPFVAIEVAVLHSSSCLDRLVAQMMTAS